MCSGSKSTAVVPIHSSAHSSAEHLAAPWAVARTTSSLSAARLPGLLQRKPEWLRVARVLLLVMRNASVSILGIWPLLLCFRSGNVFSGFPPAVQSTPSFFVATMMWSKTINWLTFTAAYAALLLTQEATTPHAGPLPSASRFLLTATKLGYCTMWSFISSTLLTLGVGVGLYFAPLALQQVKLQGYITVVAMYYDTLEITLAAAKMHEEPGSPQPQSPREKYAHSRRLGLVFVQLLSNLVSSLVLSLCVQCSTFFELRTPLHVYSFAVAGFVVKLALNQTVRAQVLKRQHMRSVGAMAAFVSLPNFLVDTQLRIVIMRAQNSQVTVVGTLAMAVFEIYSRASKARMIHAKVRMETRRMRMTTMATVAVASNRLRRRSTKMPPPLLASLRRGSTISEFERWKTRLLHFHAAEVYADMVAEYVALGCAYTILFFYWKHPKYMLSRRNGELPLRAGDSGGVFALVTATTRQMQMLAVQLGTEIVVDYVSALLETMAGVRLELMHRHALFMALFLVWAAVGSIAIVSNMLLRQ